MVLAESVVTAKEGSATPDYASRLPCVFPEEALLANKVDETREDRSGSKRRVSDARQVIVVFACVFPQIAVLLASKFLFYGRQKLHANEGLQRHNQAERAIKHA